MKLIVLGIAILTSLPVFSQDLPVAGFVIFRTRDGFRVERDDGRSVNVTAASIDRTAPPYVLRFKGAVEITINGVDVRADELDYHLDSGEFEPYGNVHLKIVPPPNQ